LGRRSEQTLFQRRHIGGQRVHEKMLPITNHKGNANQNHKIPPHTWLISKRQEISVGEDLEKRESLCTGGENANWCSHYGKQYGGASKK